MKLENLFLLTIMIISAQVTSVKIQKNNEVVPRPGCVWTYHTCDQTGPYLEYCTTNNSQEFAINDYVGSLKYGANTTWGLDAWGAYTYPLKPDQQPPCFLLKRFRKYRNLEVKFTI